MIDETKLLLEDGEDTNLQDEQSMFSFQNLFAMLVLNWQWFLLSLFICLCGALIYLRYAKPVYKVSAKMLIKDDDTRRRSSANQMLANMQDFGFMSNSAGIDNEVEILSSRILAREAIKDLKLYTQYFAYGRLSKHLIYKKQPVNVEIDSVSLDQWDKELLDGAKSIKLTISRSDDKYYIEGETLYKGESTSDFSKTLSSLPGTVKTAYGVLTFLQNGKNVMEDGQRYMVTIQPPMALATSYVKDLEVSPTSKLTSIAELTLNDRNVNRGIDYLMQLAECYNRQANADKNEIALKTEEFINTRLENYRD